MNRYHSSSSLSQCPHCTNLNRSRKSSDLLPTDHFLRESRDPSSPIVCPELKSTQCQMCFKMGHTRSHCPSQIKSWRSYAIQEIVKENDKSLPKTINKFSALCDSDSSDSESIRPNSPDYPPPDWSE